MDFVAAECSARLICFDFSVSSEPTAEGGGGGGAASAMMKVS